MYMIRKNRKIIMQMEEWQIKTADNLQTNYKKHKTAMPLGAAN